MFRDRALARFVERAAAHLRAEQPERWAGAAEGDLAAFAKRGLERARARRIEEEDDVLHFLELLGLFGESFGETAETADWADLFQEQEIRADWPRSRLLFIGLADGPGRAKAPPR